MLLFPNRVRWNCTDVMEIHPPFDTRCWTLLRLSETLRRVRDTLVLGEDLPHGPGGARQPYLTLLEALIPVQVILIPLYILLFKMDLNMAKIVGAMV